MNVNHKNNNFYSGKSVFMTNGYPDIDYEEPDYESDDDYDPDYDEEPDYDVEADYRIDEFTIGIRSDDEPDFIPMQNRFQQNPSSGNEGSSTRTHLSMSTRPHLTMRQARKIAQQLGVLNELQEANSGAENWSFEPEIDYDEESIDFNQRRVCWAKSCHKVGCRIHSNWNHRDENTVHFSYSERFRKYQVQK